MARRSKRTPEREKKIIDLLKAGNTRKTSYTAAGITDKTFAAWLKTSDFSDAVKVAEEEAVARNVMVIANAAKKSWQAAAWWLERRRPEDYARRDNYDITTKGEQVGGNSPQVLIVELPDNGRNDR